MAFSEKNRVEAFSDGVFAIAITLLILEIKVPHESIATSAELIKALLHLWPSFVAFLMSFTVILIMWVNHHELFRMVKAIDYPFLYANGFLLLVITFVPFPTAVLAEYLGSGPANVAAAFYCGTFFVIAIAYNILFQTMAHDRRLIRDEVGDDAIARVRSAYNLGLIVYAVSTVAAFLHALAGLAICTSLWALWIGLGIFIVEAIGIMISSAAARRPEQR